MLEIARLEEKYYHFEPSLPSEILVFGMKYH